MTTFLKVFFLFFCTLCISESVAQRYLAYYPNNNYKKKIQIGIGQTLEFKTKEDDSFQKGYISFIDEQYVYFNELALKIAAIDKIRVYTGKGRAIIPRVLGYGAHLYIAVRIVNSLLQSHSPIITPLELAITLPIIAAYYIYEFAFNTKYKVYNVNEKHPIKPIIIN